MTNGYANKLMNDVKVFSRFIANDTGYHRFPRLLRARINELKNHGVVINMEIKGADTQIEWAE